MTNTCNANNWTKYNNVTFLKECACTLCTACCNIIIMLHRVYVGGRIDVKHRIIQIVASSKKC